MLLIRMNSGRNMRSFARSLARSLSLTHNTAVTVHLPDLPCHGDTNWLIDAPRGTSVDECATAVRECVQATEADLLIGHSLGGKAVLQMLKQQEDDNLPSLRSVWSLDCFPGQLAYDLHGTNSTLQQLEQLVQSDGSVGTRDHAKAQMEQLGLSQRLREWVASNLVPMDSQQPKTIDVPLTYSFDIFAARQMFESYCNTDVWDVLEGKHSSGAAGELQGLHFLRAERTIQRWREDDNIRLRKIESSKSHRAAHIHTLQNAGHWVCNKLLCIGT